MSNIVPLGREQQNRDNAFPIYVDLELTDRCNLNCGFCFGPESQYGRSDLPHNYWDDTLVWLREYGVMGVVFSGGEPIIYPTVTNLLRKARDLEFQVILSTNGLLKTKVFECAEWTDWIALPLDGYSEEMQAAMRGHRLGIGYIDGLVREIRERYPDVHVKLGTVATIKNLEEIPLIGLAMKERDVPIETWKIYQYTPRRKTRHRASEFLVPDKRYESLSHDVIERLGEVPFRIVFSSNQSRSRAYLFVYPDGSLVVPNVGREMGDHVIGNLFSEGKSLLEKVNGINHAHNVSNYTSTYTE